MMTTLNGRYQIIQVLGHGGFGETFLAEDTYLPSHRRCVIKQLKPSDENQQMHQVVQQKFQQERFQREAATLEKLGEVNVQIPKLYAYFAENEQFYLVQEWIQGPTLTDIVTATGKMSEIDVQNILVSLLCVLDRVHSAGIIHRDIKPDNIILRSSNNEPVLIDFGAVKETVATVINSQGKTDRSIIVGTPGFMAPEQAAGRPIYASDLYSLGLTAIYMLTGRHPQELNLDSETGEVLWHEYVEDISKDLIAILDRAITYHPRDRYTTAQKMLEALQSISPVPVKPQIVTQATVAVAPNAASSESPTVFSPQKPAKAIAQPANKGNLLKNLLIGSLLTGSLLAVALFIGFGQDRVPQSSEITNSPTSTPEGTASPVAPTTDNSPQTDNEATAPTSPTPQPDNEITAPTSPTSQPENEVTAPTSPPAPAETNQVEPSNSTQANVIGFPPGTSESRVRAALGNPDRTSRGVWGNTRAVIYEVEPERITLGYLYDRNSGQIRQTEVAFAQSVELEQMQATLRGMLGDRITDNIIQGLQQVRSRRTNNYSFNTGNLEGTIERNERDRIYIGVWDADLH
ncbi:protein kinase domain-containing protein [Aliterella atlantica]|uniref:non-specific serine/threonine protein kinase n=1 Tax=Aliterella atlantica CENA595 TaxID=1618023 RepID=A0A0D8ZVC0_9CYAN|nr:protein kinase [Aliterella atlantica]KJH72337.1 serine/threonine protein kinase [Aliterella atlantica CENA595]